MPADQRPSTGRGTVTDGAAHQPFDHPASRPSIGGHPNGKRSSWVLAGLVVAAFLAGGTALILHLWWLFWMCVGIVGLSVPAGRLIRVMDDTVAWGATPLGDEVPLPGRAQEHAHEHAHEHAAATGGEGRPG
jgi:hypothetical protein